VIGWIGYFKAKNGQEKSHYMSLAEIDDWASEYVKDYDRNPNWKDPKKRPTMEMKTVLRQLLNWTDKTGTEGAKLAEALQIEDTEPEEIVNAETETEPEPEETTIHPLTIEEARSTLVKVAGKDKLMGELTIDQLNYIVANSILMDRVEAAKLVLSEDYNVEPPAPKTAEQLQKELGF
jgi:recombinational DNA repair protein RecT